MTDKAATAPEAERLIELDGKDLPAMCPSPKSALSWGRA